MKIRYLLRVMRLLVLFFSVGLLHVSAGTYSQTVSLRGKQLQIEDVLQAIRQQTGYAVYVNVSHLEGTKPVSIDADNMPLQQFLATVLREQPLQAKVEDKTIVLSRRADAESALVLSMPQSEIIEQIRGTVRDLNGEPIPSATVVVLLSDRSVTTKGTVTDANGRFELREVPRNAFLQVTSVGYAGAQIVLADVSDYANVGVTLQEQQTQLEDIAITVNTGYQRIRPEQSTGAVSQITTREYESRVSTNFLDGLVNRLPGLMINNDVNFTSIAPNGGQSSRSLFNIRGISTMSANQNPLIVIDGYPTELTLDMIDPNEIKSVTILKDAAAATIYGVRASNGVIVIEKKEAVAGRPAFSFRASTGITPEEDYSRYRWIDDVSAHAVAYQREHLSSQINANTWDQLASGGSLAGSASRSPVYYVMAQLAAGMITDAQAEQRFAELSSYDNVNDYQRLFTRPRVTQSYNLNASGGSTNALYYITANYIDNLNSAKGAGNNRFLLSARSTLRLSERLSLELNTDYQERRDRATAIPGMGHPFERYEDVNGNPTFLLGSGISPWYNDVMMSQGLEDHLYYPLIDMNLISDRTRAVNNSFKADFRYRLGAGFNVSLGGIYETSESDNQYYAPEESSAGRRLVNAYVQRNAANGTLQYHVPKGGYLRRFSDNTSGYTFRGQLNYDKVLSSDHSINGIVGAEIRNLITKDNRSALFGYNDETLLHQPVDFAGLNNGTLRGNYQLGAPLERQFTNWFGTGYVEDRFVSGYTNLIYSFRNTYSVSASLRIDQSNLFGTNPKYKYKPLWSTGAAWNIHRESFMEDALWLNQLKLRAAFGFNGNVAKMSLPEVIARTVLNPYTSPSSPGLDLVSYANSSLHWEQTRNFNVGLDYNLFGNISGTVDYYQKKSTDLMGNTLIDPTIGVSPTLINQATISNRGIEFSLRADWISTPRLNWHSGLVVARNTSKVLDVYQEGSHNPAVRNNVGFVQGYPVGALFAYRYAGLDTLGFPIVEDEHGVQYHANDRRTGSPLDIVMSSDTSGVIRYMGSSIPTINAGLSNRVDIGNFYVYAMMNYYGGFKVRLPRPNPSVSRPLEGADTYWRVPGDELNTDVMSIAAYEVYLANSAFNNADKFVVNGDYLTLADLTVSYRLDGIGFLRNAGFRNFEIKAQASNIWTIGLNKYNYSQATRSYEKSYLTPTYTLSIHTNF